MKVLKSIWCLLFHKSRFWKTTGRKDGDRMIWRCARCGNRWVKT